MRMAKPGGLLGNITAQTPISEELHKLFFSMDK
jgi:hypothetical protein